MERSVFCQCRNLYLWYDSVPDDWLGKKAILGRWKTVEEQEDMKHLTQSDLSCHFHLFILHFILS